jgi:L-gulonolactone oxidase
VSSRVFRHSAVGDSAQILSPLSTSPRKVYVRSLFNAVRRRQSAELAVAAPRAASALADLDELFRAHKLALNHPIGLRATAADRFTLSPCSGRTTIWLDVFYDPLPAFVEGLARLTDAHEMRCHWGKSLAVAPDALRRRYPGWDAFRAARARFDPDEVFANRFTDRLGLTGAATR